MFTYRHQILLRIARIYRGLHVTSLKILFTPHSKLLSKSWRLCMQPFVCDLILFEKVHWRYPIAFLVAYLQYDIWCATIADLRVNVRKYRQTHWPHSDSRLELRRISKIIRGIDGALLGSSNSSLDPAARASRSISLMKILHSLKLLQEFTRDWEAWTITSGVDTPFKGNNRVRCRRKTCLDS